jgi:hypothetical protein
MAMAYGGKHQPMEFVLLGDNISPSSRPGHERYAPACILDGPAQRVVYAGPDQSLQSVGSGAANGLPDRIGKNPKSARANIVTWADRRVGHVVDTSAQTPGQELSQPVPHLAKMPARGSDRIFWRAHAMNDGSKVAAATLAAEAARQKQAMKTASMTLTGHDIAGELLTYYRYFLKEIDKQAP